MSLRNSSFFEESFFVFVFLDELVLLPGVAVVLDWGVCLVLAAVVVAAFFFFFFCSVTFCVLAAASLELLVVELVVETAGSLVVLAASFPVCFVSRIPIPRKTAEKRSRRIR